MRNAPKKPRIVNGVALWLCSKCDERKPSEDFGADSRAANGLQSSCRKCVYLANKARADADPAKIRAYRREYYADNLEYFRTRGAISARKWAKANPEKRLEQGRKWKRANAAKERAHAAVNHAIRDGRLTKPRRCSECHGSGPTEGHHDDYSRVLDVRWLCVTCHGKAHRKYK